VFNEKFAVIEIERKMSEETTSTKAQTQPKVPFEEIAHTADRALRIYGSNMQELLLNAAMGMNTLMVAEFTPSSRQEEKSVEFVKRGAEIYKEV